MNRPEAAISPAPAATATRGVARRPTATADTLAAIAPGVIASPAWSSEYPHSSVSTRTPSSIHAYRLAPYNRDAPLASANVRCFHRPVSIAGTGIRQERWIAATVPATPPA